MAVNTVDSGAMGGPSESDLNHHRISDHEIGLNTAEGIIMGQCDKPTPTILT